MYKGLTNVTISPASKAPCIANTYSGILGISKPMQSPFFRPTDDIKAQAKAWEMNLASP